MPTETSRSSGKVSAVSISAVPRSPASLRHVVFTPSSLSQGRENRADRDGRRVRKTVVLEQAFDLTLVRRCRRDEARRAADGLLPPRPPKRDGDRHYAAGPGRVQ